MLQVMMLCNCVVCIRISYGLLLEIFAFVYMIVLPLAIQDSFGLLIVPTSFCLTMCYNNLLDIAQQLEDPFGYDASDLNLDAFCHTTETQVTTTYI